MFTFSNIFIDTNVYFCNYSHTTSNTTKNAIPGDPWMTTMDTDVPVLPAAVVGVPRIAGRDDR